MEKLKVKVAVKDLSFEGTSWYPKRLMDIESLMCEFGLTMKDIGVLVATKEIQGRIPEVIYDEEYGVYSIRVNFIAIKLIAMEGEFNLYAPWKEFCGDKITSEEKEVFFGVVE